MTLYMEKIVFHKIFLHSEGVAGVAGPSDHELAMSLQRQDAAGVERDQAWSQFKQSQLGGEGGQLSE